MCRVQYTIIKRGPQSGIEEFVLCKNQSRLHLLQFKELVEEASVCMARKCSTLFPDRFETSIY